MTDPIEPTTSTTEGAEPTAAPTETTAAAPQESGGEHEGGLKESVIKTLKTVFDPEIPVDIYELGLIYSVEVTDESKVDVSFTLTSPNCPAAQSIPAEMERKIRDLGGVTDVKLDLTWEPPWTPDLMSDAAKLKMNMF